MYFENSTQGRASLYMTASENFTTGLSAVSFENSVTEEELAGDAAGSCKGTAGSFGTLGCATGCAGTFGSLGSYGCGS